MVSQKELLSSIKEMEGAPPTYQNMQKLATFYTIYDHLNAPRSNSASIQETVRQDIVDYYGDSDFLKEIEDKDAEQMWLLMDELMSTIKALQPRLYEATMQEIKRMI